MLDTVARTAARLCDAFDAAIFLVEGAELINAAHHGPIPMPGTGRDPIVPGYVSGRVVLEKSFAYPHAILQKAVNERVTGLPLVPTMAALLLQMDLSRYDWSALRYLTNTAAALPTEHIRRLCECFPNARLFSMYGLTECKRVSYLPPDQLAIRRSFRAWRHR